MTHSEAVREQERRVVEAAIVAEGYQHALEDEDPYPCVKLCYACAAAEAVRKEAAALRILRAATCQTCHGAGGEWFNEFSGDRVTHHCNECPDCKGTGRIAPTVIKEAT